MEEIRNTSNGKEATESCGSETEDVQKILDSEGEHDEKKEENEKDIEGIFRERKTSGSSINEFITRHGWKVEKLPTFHHLHISELSHKVLDFQDKIHSEFVRQWRSVVTGDPNK